MASFRNKLKHLRSFDHKASEVAFLLGGIGTGNVSIGARGQLRDWEIFNKPGKGNKFPYSLFAIHIDDGKQKYNRALEAAVQPPHSLSHGFDSGDAAGLPRFKESVFRGEYPLATVDLIDDRLPVSVSMEAFTPFIPLNADDSSFPVAVIRYYVKNIAEQSLQVSVAGSLANMTTFNGYGPFNYPIYAGETVNKLVHEGHLHGILMESVGFPDNHPMRCSMSISTSNPQYTAKPTWYQGAWYDSVQDFWNEFSQSGKLFEHSVDSSDGSTLMNQSGQRIGSIVPYTTLEPGEESVFEFFISWHVPNRLRSWAQNYDPKDVPKTVRNHYAGLFTNAFDAAVKLHARLPELEEKTLLFHEAMFSSTLPDYVLDALASNITVIRSTTCFRIEGGMLFGWEGCFGDAGCCDGSCTHVWNYEQTLAFLFPELAQTMRLNEFAYEVESDGKMNFRARKVLEDPEWKLSAAVDGQNGTIVRLYREWKLSGDNSLIDDLGESALLALDYALPTWDSDGDGVLDSEQHNTYDIEFYGPNSLANSMYFAALKAGVEIASYLGLEDKAKHYQQQFDSASKLMDEMLWGGEYYIQQIEDVDRYRYQYGKGCLSDQILGQYMAHICNLGYVLPEQHIKDTIHSIYKYNFKKNLSEHENVQRTFALNDEAGLLLCSWPHGGRPRFPFVYADEVWTGIEYQVAATLIYEGFVNEGLEITRAVRDRHDGIRRNPYNEVECGHHYARSLASWALLTSLSGYKYDLTKDQISFNPKINSDNFTCFFSNGKQWGVFSQKVQNGQLVQEVKVLYEAK